MAVKNISDVPLEVVEAGTGVVHQVLIGPDEATNFIMRRFIMEPGGGLPRHKNKIEHQQYVLSGRAKVGLGDEVFEVGPTDVVYVPAGVPHWYRAEGDGPFEILCLIPTGPDQIELVDD